MSRVLCGTTRSRFDSVADARLEPAWAPAETASAAINTARNRGFVRSTIANAALLLGGGRLWKCYNRRSRPFTSGAESSPPGARALRVSDLPHKKYTGKNLREGANVSPYPVSRLAAPISLVDSARWIEQASETVALRTNAQLEVIVEQMQALQAKAREIMSQAINDVDLIRAECRFQRVPGKIYHLYERQEGRR